MTIIEIEQSLTYQRQKEFRVVEQLQKVADDISEETDKKGEAASSTLKLYQDLETRLAQIREDIDTLKLHHEQALKAQRERKDRQSNIRKITCSLLPTLPLDTNLSELIQKAHAIENEIQNTTH